MRSSMLQDAVGVQEGGQQERQLVGLPRALVQAGQAWLQQIALKVQEGRVGSLHKSCFQSSGLAATF